MNIRKQIYVVSLLVLTACGTAKVASIPPASSSSLSQADADRGAKRFNGLTLNDLNKGKTLYEEKCTGCHGLKFPASETEAAWKEIVPEMAKKANKKFNNQSMVPGTEFVDATTQDLILKYVITMGPLTKAK